MIFRLKTSETIILLHHVHGLIGEKVLQRERTDRRRLLLAGFAVPWSTLTTTTSTVTHHKRDMFARRKLCCVCDFAARTHTHARCYYRLLFSVCCVVQAYYHTIVIWGEPYISVHRHSYGVPYAVRSIVMLSLSTNDDRLVKWGLWSIYIMSTQEWPL